jgi:hypothetical protein
MKVKGYTKEFYMMNIKVGHIEGDMEKVVRYINGLIYNIQEEIGMLIVRTIEDAYQETSKVEEKIARKKSQSNRGRGTIHGRGSTSRGRIHITKGEGEISGNQSPRRGDFRGRRFGFRGRGREREIRC